MGKQNGGVTALLGTKVLVSKVLIICPLSKLKPKCCRIFQLYIYISPWVDRKPGLPFIFVFGGRCCPANSFLKVHCQHFSGSCRASSMPNTSATASTFFYPRWSHLQWEENINTVIILDDEIRWTCTWPEVDEQSFFNSLVLHTTDAYIYL